MQCPELRYKERVLAPDIEEDSGMYAVRLVVRSPDGAQRTTGVLGDFPCPVEALRFAFQYGMAEIDHRQLPAPDWTADDWHGRQLRVSGHTRRRFLSR